MKLDEVPNNMLQFTEEDEMHDKLLKWHFIHRPHKEQLRNLRNFKYFGYLIEPKDITPILIKDKEISIQKISAKAMEDVIISHQTFGSKVVGSLICYDVPEETYTYCYLVIRNHYQ